MGEARDTMQSVAAMLTINDLFSGNTPEDYTVHSIDSASDGSDVAVLGYLDLDGPAVMVGTVNPADTRVDGEEADSILKLTPAEARKFAEVLNLAADAIEEKTVEVAE